MEVGVGSVLILAGRRTRHRHRQHHRRLEFDPGTLRRREARVADPPDDQRLKPPQGQRGSSEERRDRVRPDGAETGAITASPGCAVECCVGGEVFPAIVLDADRYSEAMKRLSVTLRVADLPEAEKRRCFQAALALLLQETGRTGPHDPSDDARSFTQPGISPSQTMPPHNRPDAERSSP